MADVQFALLTFTSPGSSGTQDITNSALLGGSTPKCAIFYGGASIPSTGAIDMRMCLGFTDGTGQHCNSLVSQNNRNPTRTYRERRNNRVIRQADSATFNSAAFTSFITDGVRITWDAGVVAGREYSVLLIWGADFSCKVGSQNLGSGTSAIAVTGVGFEPDALLVNNIAGGAVNTQLLFGLCNIGIGINDGSLTQRVMSFITSHGVAGAQPTQHIDSDAIAAEVFGGTGVRPWTAAITAYGPDGFDITPSANTNWDGLGGTTIYYLAMNFGGAAFDLIDLSTPTTTGDDVISGFGFDPGFMMGVASSMEAYDVSVVDGLTSSGISFIAATGFYDQAVQVTRERYDANPTANYEYLDNARFLRIANNISVGSVQATITLLATDTIQLNYTSVEANAKKGFFLVVEGALGPDPTPMEVRDTQQGISLLSKSDAVIRDTQLGGSLLSKQSALLRVTQMGTLILARGAVTPLVPDGLTLGDQGRSSPLRQRLVNMYSEPTPQGPTASARFGRPGLETIATRGEGPIRATFLWRNLRVTVSGNKVYLHDQIVGELPDTDNLPVRWAVSDDECVIVTNRRAYYVSIYDVTIMDNENLLDVIDVAFLAGRFVYVSGNLSGAYYFSETGDARTVDGNNFASAESNPDPIRGVVRIGDALAFIGSRTVEFHYATTSITAPFQRSSGRAYDKGSEAPHSFVLCDNTMFFVGNDRRVYRAEGVPVLVSNYDVADRLRKVTDEDMPKITGFTVNFGGHEWYVINLPGQGTWAHDVKERTWVEWKSWNKDRFRVQVADNNFMGDFYSGRLLGFDGGLFTDLGDPIQRVCSTFAPVRNGLVKNFNLSLMCKKGVGLSIGHGTSPVVEMRYSDDQDSKWSNWMAATLGAMADTSRGAMALWIGLGSMRPPGRQFEFRCSDPVEFIPYDVKINEVRP